MKFAHEKILEYRDELSARGVTSKNDLFLPCCLTCNNIKIEETVGEMKNSYFAWKDRLNCKIRRFLKAQVGKKLTKPEQEEE